MIGQTHDHYRILEKIGEGGMGVVYRAKDEHLDREVALKVLPAGTLADDRARRRFRKEALALSQLNHPNIATVHDFDTQDGVDFLVMELIPGITLAEKLSEGALTEIEIGRLGVQLAEGLTAAHDRGVVHQDVKPGNLRVTPDGRLKILDFGLAKVLQSQNDSAATQTSTDTQAIAGTLPYMSPEQLRGEPATILSDIYSAGAVLYEMACGCRPFPQAVGALLIDAILHDAPQPPGALCKQLNPALESVILKALDKDPARRYQSAKELRVDLERLGSLIPPPATRPTKLARRKKLLAMAVLVLVLISAGELVRERMRPTAPAGRITLAVLPFQTQSVPEDIRFLGIGIPDAIITRLANIGKILPRPTTAILRYENQSPDLKDVGRALASEYVLTGIVHEVGERLRVSVQLVRVKDGTPLWGKPFDMARSDLLSLQDAIAEQVAENLNIRMTAEERVKVYQRFTTNVAAYELYLQGRSRLVRSTPEDTRAAVKAFESALRLDPNYVLARAGVALSSALMRLRFAPETETNSWGERAEREARAALDLEPNLAEAHEALAAVYRAIEFDWAAAIEESRLALELNPNLDQPHYYRAASFYHLGLFELAESEVRKGEAVNPGNRADPLRQRGISALYTGRFHEAIPLLLEVQQVTNGHTFDWFLGQAYYYDGEHMRAEELLTNMRGNRPADRRAQAILASFLAARGERPQAEALLRTLITGGGFVDHHVTYSIGVAYLHLGNRAEAQRRLLQAAQTGLLFYPWYQQDPLLEPLRSDLEFQRFLGEMRKSWESVKERYQPKSR